MILKLVRFEFPEVKIKSSQINVNIVCTCQKYAWQFEPYIRNDMMMVMLANYPKKCVDMLDI